MTHAELLLLARGIDFHTRSLNMSELPTSRAHYAAAAQRAFDALATFLSREFPTNDGGTVCLPLTAELGGLRLELTRIDKEVTE